MGEREGGRDGKEDGLILSFPCSNLAGRVSCNMRCKASTKRHSKGAPQRQRQRHSETDTDRDRQTQRGTERHKDRQREEQDNNVNSLYCLGREGAVLGTSSAGDAQTSASLARLASRSSGIVKMWRQWLKKGREVNWKQRGQKEGKSEENGDQRHCLATQPTSLLFLVFFSLCHSDRRVVYVG